jgi:hypothetical protein
MKGISAAARDGFLHMRLNNLNCGAAGEANVWPFRCLRKQCPLVIRRQYQSLSRPKIILPGAAETSISKAIISRPPVFVLKDICSKIEVLTDIYARLKLEVSNLMLSAIQAHPINLHS